MSSWCASVILSRAVKILVWIIWTQPIHRLTPLDCASPCIDTYGKIRLCIYSWVNVPLCLHTGQNETGQSTQYIMFPICMCSCAGRNEVITVCSCHDLAAM